MIQSSPYHKKNRSVAQMMQWVLLACLPGAVVLFSFFGWGVLFNLIVCSSVALAAEAAILHYRKRPIIRTLNDYSALVTAVLLALALPPLAPWWVATIGTLFAIVFAKHLYGGLGYNPFNPAMAGYVVLLISFPVAMTSWLPPDTIAQVTPGFVDSLSLYFLEQDTQQQSLNTYRLGVDGFTMATPLDEMKTRFGMGFIADEILVSPIFDGWQNVGWQWVNVAFLVGGLLLIIQRVITWHIPVTLLASVFIVSTVFYWFDSNQYIPPMMHLLSGATMMGAFLIATDPVSASTTPKGRLVYAAGIGILMVFIRNFGGYPDAVAFAVLLMNMAVPVIDHYTQPVVYGAQKKKPQSHQELL